MAADLQTKIIDTLAVKKQFDWVLSGGNTPRQLYERLAREPYKSRIPWEKMRIFWGDERPVPPTQPDSNFHMANQALLRLVPIQDKNIFRIKGELPPAEAAHDYEWQLQSLFGQAPPAFDLIFLGMGPDGHTASLFPGTSALTVDDRAVTENVVPAQKSTRITLTFRTLNNAHEVWFLATGAEKAAVYAKVRSQPDIHYPSSLIRPIGGIVRWYVDDAITHPV